MTAPVRDRYVTFDGLDCDANARKVVETIQRHLSGEMGAGQWGSYFSGKFSEQQRMGVDDLFFVGSQMNTLYAFFEACADDAAAELLYQVEQECC